MENHIPPPGVGRKSKYCFGDIKPNGSKELNIKYTRKDMINARSSATQYANRHNMEFILRKSENNKIMIYRVK